LECAWLKSWWRTVFCPFISFPFFRMFVLRDEEMFVSSTRSTGMPKSSSIWAFRLRSSLKFSVGIE